MYILDGGGLSISRSATLTGTGGVSLFDSAHSGSCGSISITGGGILRLTAMSTGPLGGVALAQDRNCTTTMTLSVNAAATVTGNVYLPAAELKITGNGVLSGTGTDLVVDAFVASGKGSATLN